MREHRPAAGWYARALALLPRAFVEEYGADMQATHEEHAADARRRGRLAQVRYGARELAGLVRLAVTERLAARRARRAQRQRERTVQVMEHAVRDVAHALRRLGRTPGFTAAAVLTLALAIGANAAIFTLVQRVVLSPLPYPESERLIALDHTAPGLNLPRGVGMTVGLYREYAQLPSLEATSIYMPYGQTLSGEGEAERLDVLIATPSLAAVLGVQPQLGRWFTEAEGRRGAGGVVVLTHGLWQSRFGGDPGVLGRTLRLDGNAYEVIGVMPRGFAFPDERPQLLLPLQLDLTQARPGGFNFRGVARLAPGVTVERARREQDGVIADIPARFPEHPGPAQMMREAQVGSLAVPLKDSIVGDTTRTLWVLLGSVAIVLLIACANIANLFLVRTASRRREVAVRRALGAAQSRVAGYFLAETMVVCAVAGVIGLGIAYLAVDVLRATSLVNLPRLHEVRIDAATIACALVLAGAAGLLFGIMPLLRRQPAVASVLHDEARGNTGGEGRMRVRHALMALQVALAVMLLVGAGLLVRSFERLRSVDPGFAADARLTFRVGLSESQHRDNASTSAFHERLLERVAALPGVQGAALTTTLPLQGDGWGDPFDVRGRPTPDGAVNPIARVRRVSPDYFDVMSMRLLRGRSFDAGDAAGATNGIVVNEAFVAQYFPGEEAIGQAVRTLGSGDDDWLTIVGVVGNTATYSLREAGAVAQVFVSLHSATAAALPSTHNVGYVLRTAGEPLALVPAIRRVLDELDPHVALARPEPLTEIVARARASLAFTTLLLVTAASVALLLGLIGVYAVIAYGVAQRRAEIGVRLALGAQPRDVVGMIARQSGAVIAVGVVAGLAGAVATARLMRALLFGVAWNDAVTYAAVALGLFTVAMLACWVPARRAARLDPLQALH